MVSLIIGLIAAIIALFALQLRSVRTYLIRNTSLSHVDVAEPTLLNLAKGLRAELKSLGFGAEHWVTSPFSLVSSSEQKEWSIFSYHSDGIWARIHLKPLPDALEPVTISFLSLRDGSTLIETQGARRQPRWPAFPNTQITMYPDRGLPELLDAHSNGRPFDAMESVGDLLAHLNMRKKAALQNAAKAKDLSIVAENTFRPTWRGAWNILRSGISYRKQSTPGPALHSSDGDGALIARMYGDALARYTQRVRPKRSRQRSLILATVSLLTAAGSFLWWFPLWQVALFISILLLHEMGHVFAMRLTGHSEASVFFLPFFGAAVVGQKKDSNSSERVFVALMGSIPGLIVALVAFPWILDGTLLDSTVWSLGWTLLVLVNWLNLMPVLPLDGGHVLNLLVFSRYPSLESAFRVLSFSGLLVAGVWLSQPWLLVAFAISMLIAASQHRVALLANDMRRQVAMDPDNRFHLYAHRLLARRGRDIQFPAALAIVEATEWRRNQHPLPKTPTLLFLTLYMAALVTPPVLWWLTLHG